MLDLELRQIEGGTQPYRVYNFNAGYNAQCLTSDGPLAYQEIGPAIVLGCMIEHVAEFRKNCIVDENFIWAHCTPRG